MAPIKLTNANFSQTVLDSEKPVLVDFWAAWCGPCVQLAPVIDQLAESYENKAIIAKLDVDQNQEIAQKYAIMSIPTLLIFKNGEVIDKVIGVVNKSLLSKKLDAAV